MYEHTSRPLLSRRHFFRRLWAHFLLASAIVFTSLGVGIAGYRITEGLSFIDALLNASMILGGMGPVNELRTPAGKVFASFYALFSGMLFLVVAGIMIAPVAHRLLHWMRLEKEEKLL
ncbi:MAG TPA: hypothetical protein VMG34_12415 [Bacteroidota bacterium]|nr:hypothetical protein [Bacteroidota bacterium]